MRAFRILGVMASLAVTLSFLSDTALSQGDKRNATNDQTAKFDAIAVFKSAVTKYKSLNSLKIEFTQTITSALTGAKSTSNGEMLRQNPGLFSINFLDPETDRIVSDGTHLWVYLPSSAPNQVIKSTIKSGSKIAADPLDLILSSSEKEYKISAHNTGKLDGRNVKAIKLVPTSASTTSLRSAILWIDDLDGTVKKIETVETSGLQRSIAITKYLPNAAVKKSEFQFKPTKKMRVIAG